ncbi:MAG: methyltransferase domain-containing protein [Eubacteriales bacterium]|nr:methyltransferase domain-containing protein [Eubacteriales bacterium]
MYEELLHLGKRPSLWQRSAESLWDDSHIQKMMLESHLNPNSDNASRRADIIERSVKWLCKQIPPCAKILDLGCGPGLYTKRFSDKGYDVTGIDISKGSIDYAKEADRKTRYICRDYLTLDEKETYDVITLIYCDYAALTKPEREVMLSKVTRLLHPDGLFIFDVFAEAYYAKKREATHWYLRENGGFWSPEPHICLEGTYLYENNTVSADQYVVITEDRTKEYIIWDTVFTKQSLMDEVEAAGLFVKNMFGDICGKKYNERSETLCCIAAKAVPL